MAAVASQVEGLRRSLLLSLMPNGNGGYRRFLNLQILRLLRPMLRKCRLAHRKVACKRMYKMRVKYLPHSIQADRRRALTLELLVLRTVKKYFINLLVARTWSHRTHLLPRLPHRFRFTLKTHTQVLYFLLPSLHRSILLPDPLPFYLPA